MRTRRIAAVLAMISSAATGAAVFDGTPGAAHSERWGDFESRRTAFVANGYAWPPEKQWVGWPPREGQPFSESYLRSRYEMEARIRATPLDVHWRVDDFEALAQSWILPRFTPNGFKIVDARTDERLRGVWLGLQEHYNARKGEAARRETFAGSDKQGVAKNDRPIFIGDSKQSELNRAVTKALKPICEEWASTYGPVRLQPTSTYGVRVYPNGSTLFNHVDIPDTHIISAIFHIDHDLDEPWPLEIEDHDGNVHALALEPGQVALYESATQFHSRVTPMRGRDYGSVFVHYKPVGWTWSQDDIVTAMPLDRREYVARNRKHARDLAATRKRLNPLERYRRKYYRDRNLPLLEFSGDDRLALPVQNANMMKWVPMEAQGDDAMDVANGVNLPIPSHLLSYAAKKADDEL